MRNTNLIATLQQDSAFHFEEIVMKNETDLQQSLDQLLPPKPVFLSTMFLLQDSENIFEMQPAERLTVLKNVFGLLGIDEAKEQVQDKKRELSYKLKALQDQSHQNAKLRKFLKNLYTDYQSLQASDLLSAHHCEE
jgi:DNA repair exonuclease SbcCD ATPase subunit